MKLPPRPVRNLPLQALAYAAFVTAFSWLVLGAGSPALRHDWLFPLDNVAGAMRMLDLGTGWGAEGLGQPNPYPMTYLATWPLALVCLLFGGRAALLVLIVAVASAAAYAGAQIARRLELPVATALLLGVFLLFNPWTYSKIVAGHLTQIIAYIGLVLVANELLGDKPGARRLALSIVLSALQTQFFLVALALCGLRLRLRSVRYSMVAGLIVFLPSIIGICLDRNSLLALPFTVAWENNQSVPMLDGLLLKGYFPHYADLPFGGVGIWGVLGFLMLAAAAPLLARSRSSIAAFALCFAALLFASGTTGWLSLAWRWAIVHMPVIGVFRELYDLIALVAAGYALLAAMTMARMPVTRWIALAAALILVSVWCFHSPAEYWVAAESLPKPSENLAHVARYALMPPFQPLSYRGRGSGADTLYVGRSMNNAPVNTFLPFYPANTALSKFWLFGDTGDLARVGVGLIDCRPGFAEAEDSLTYYGRGLVAHASPVCHSAETLVRDAAPIVALQPMPRTCSLCSNSGAGNIFFADARGELPALFDTRIGGWFRTIDADREFVRPQDGWIDARLEFPQMPWLGQPLGGSYTTQSTAPLSVGEAPFVLANVRGSLRDASGRALSGNTEGYRWLRLPNRVDRVYCRGACLVAGVGDPENVPLDPPSARSMALDSSVAAPWVVSVSLPPRAAGVIRYLETFDSGWVAIQMPGTRLLPHIRLDAVFNGWVVPRRSAPSNVLLVHLTSILQIIAGVAGFFCVLVVAIPRRPAS